LPYFQRLLVKRTFAPSPIVNKVNSSLLIALTLSTGFLLGAVVLALGVWLFRASSVSLRLTRRTFNPVPADVATALDVLATAVIVLDPKNNVLSSSAGAKTTGLVQYRRLIHDELAELSNRARETGQPEEIEAELPIGIRGTSVYVSAKAASLNAGHIILLVDDRTDSIRLDEMRRDFVANVSHELKTPVGAIGLLAETIKDSTDDPEMVKKFAGSMVKESRRLSSLIQDIIQLSRVQSNDVSTQSVLIDVNTVVAEAVDRAEFLSETNKITMRTSEAEDAYVFGDFELLVTAVKNLIENAIVYSDRGSQVGVGVKVIDEQLEIAVTDSGIGIALEDQPRVFERFYRVDQSRTRETGGTGLGLSIVKHVAIRHRGEVKLFSKLGLGSTFTLCLPNADPESMSNETPEEANK